jgi:FkbM family methyltransferase
MGEESRAIFRIHMDQLPRDGIFVDLGANVGNVTAEALTYGHTIYAFEPDPWALKILRSRFSGNPAVGLIPKAVGGSARTTRFFRHAGGNAEFSSFHRQGVHDGGDHIEVEVVSIVEFLRPLLPITAIKMDIEGAEAECLEAILDAGLEKEVGVILVETHEQSSPDVASRLTAIRARIASENIDNIDLDFV